jgi:hypothetical protein
MSIFSQPFLSVAGQKERLSNVVNTLKASVFSGKVQANVSNPTLKKVLETASNNPFTTAGVIAGAINPSGALATAQAGASKLYTSFTSAKLATQVAVVGGSVVGANILVSSPKARQTVMETPSSLANVGKNVGGYIENPSVENASKIFKENPAIVGGLGLIGISLAGYKAASALSGALQTSAINKNTKAILSSDAKNPLTSESLPSLDNIQSSALSEYIPNVSDLSAVGTPTASAVTTRKSAKKHKRKVWKPQNLNIRINNNILNGKCLGYN